jgi:hypothetical protein
MAELTKEQREQFRREALDFYEAFGTGGLTDFLNGKSWDECAAIQEQQLSDELASIQAEQRLLTKLLAYRRQVEIVRETEAA